jgi:putative Holliday junction resolvase
MPEAARRFAMDTFIGFDYGPAKIGIACGQTLTGTATPLTTLRRVSDKPDWEGIGRLIETWQPAALIVGLPFNMDGTETDIAVRARRFARQLEGRFHLPVYLVDERLTSIEAKRLAAGKIKKIEELDAIAAKLILETWLREHT